MSEGHFLVGENGPEVFKLSGAVIPLSCELLDEMGTTSPISFGFRRFTHPWEFTDRNPMPTFVLLPKVERLRQRWAALIERIRDIRYVVRYGLHEPYEDD